MIASAPTEAFGAFPKSHPKISLLASLTALIHFLCLQIRRKAFVHYGIIFSTIHEWGGSRHHRFPYLVLAAVEECSSMTTESTLRFGAQTDEVTSLLRIVNMVRTGEATTRPEIGKVTGLGRGVVSQRVDQAIKMGLLADGEFGASSGGRQPRKLRFRAEQGLIVVCALGALHVRVGIAGLDGDILEHMHRNWDISRGPGKPLTW